jgi:class 3 adenylate cyclase
MGYAASQLTAAMTTNDFVALIDDCQITMSRLSSERAMSANFLLNNTFPLDELLDTQNTTDAYNQEFFDEYPDMANATFTKRMNTMRERVKNKSTNVYNMTLFYEEYVNSFKRTIGQMTRTKGEDHVAKILVTIEYVERVFVMSVLGNYIFSAPYARNDTARFQTYTKMIGIVNQYELLSSMFHSSAPTSVIAYKESFMTNYFNDAKKLLAILSAQYVDGRQIIDVSQYFDQWINITTGWQVERTNVGIYMIDYLLIETGTRYKNALAILVVCIVLLCFLFGAGTLSSVLLAKTITGPWRRLSKLQKATIRKFVPDGFMDMISVKTVKDMVPGKFVERDITMLQVEIKNLKTSGVSGETLLLLNDFLSVICPIVRKYGGFVDRYTGDGFNALFKGSKAATGASTEIQESVEEFNTQVNGSLSVGVTCHSAFALIGIVGENERIDNVVLSKESSITQRLQSVSDKLQVPIVATRQSLSNRPNHRFLGSITHKELPIEVYEIFDKRDTIKQGSTTIFNKAAQEFDKKHFYKAKALFNQIFLLNQDHVAKSMGEMCERIITQCEYELDRMRASDILKIDSLRKALEEHCKKEFSTENFDLWAAIQKFRSMKDHVEMRIYARWLYEKYCDVDSDTAVNVNDATRREVKRKLDNENYQVSRDWFDKLNIEILANLEDTAARFRESEICRELYLEEMQIGPLL